MSTSRSRITELPRAAACAALFVCATAVAAPNRDADPVRAVAPAPVQELILLVTVNAQTADEAEVVLRTADGRWWMSQQSLARWRLGVPIPAAATFGGIRYFPLDAVNGAVVTYDPHAETLRIDASPQAFGATTMASPVRSRVPPSRPTSGGFLNYELFAAHAGGEDSVAGEFEGAFFTREGVFVTSLLAQHDPGERGVTRLDSTWTTDFPEWLSTLRIGDAIGVPGAWGRAVRFGGVQYATNFATQPGFVTFPQLTASGQAALPSTVDVFVNNALVAQRSVTPGPFSITHLPTTSGGGQVELVVRDLLGREQIVTQRFYASAELLVPGLSQFAYEAGFERENFGTSSNDYGPAFATATYRRGILDDLTLEGRGEISRGDTTAGAAATWLWRGIGTFDAAVAGSAGHGSGGLTSLGFAREIERLSIFASTLATTNRFHQIGDSADSPLPRQQSTASVGYQFGRWGSANVAYVRQAFRDKSGVELVSFGYTVALARKVFLSLSFIRTSGQAGSRTLAGTLSIPFGERDIASVGFQRTRGREHDEAATASLQRSLPAGEGLGYRVLAAGRNDLQAGIAYQNNAGIYTLDVAELDRHDAVRASVAGGIGTVGGYAFVARPITDSFGVVRVGDYPGISVLLDNQPVGRTGTDGYAVIPRLRAYDRNRISIDQHDLPLDANVDALAIEAAPYFRSGILVEFPVRRAHGALLRIVLDDGTDLPPGAYVQIDGRSDRFPVALQGGVYLTGLRTTERIHASWRGRTCDIDVTVGPTQDPLPDLGTFVCLGVVR